MVAEENRIAKVKQNLPNVDTAESAVSETPAYTQAKSQATGVSERKIREELQLAKALKENPELAKCETKKQALIILGNKDLKENIKPIPRGLFNNTPLFCPFLSLLAGFHL